jgi:hypothetical protein
MNGFKPRFMATVLESMPHRDVDEACSVMMQNFPEAPNLPHTSRSYRKWVEKTPAVFLDREKKEIRFELSKRENELVEFYEHYLANDIDYFAMTPELDPGLYHLADMYQRQPWPELKVVASQVPGPYSWGLSLKDENGAPALYNDTLRDVMIKSLAMSVKWRQRKIRELFPGKQSLLIIGNGALQVFTSAGGTGNRDDLKTLYNELIEAANGMVCIHCCSNFDWSLLMETNAGIINFDAYQFGDTLALYPQALKDFIERGGMLAWGIVPTTIGGNIEKETPEGLAERLDKCLDSAASVGIDKKKLAEVSWITPTCETTTLTVDLANKVYEYASTVSKIMREKYF